MSCRHAVSLALWVAMLASETTAQGYKSNDGPFPVKVVSITLNDARRNKTLPVTVYLPQGDLRFPIVIFSHGAGGAGSLNFPLLRFWATHGYIVLCPTHEDSLLLQKQKAPLRARDVVRRALTQWQLWESRALDSRFLLDQLDAVERQLPELRGKMDAACIGVSGHSLGAFTAQLIGGATIDLPDGRKQVSFSDPRPKAFLLFSPQGRGQMGLTESSWKNFTRPFMGVTGSLDRGALGQPPEWRKEPFDFSPPGDKFHVFIHGAHHGSFLGRSAELPRTNQEGIFRWIKTVTIAFWDAYLKGVEHAKKFLLSDALERESNGAVKVFRK